MRQTTLLSNETIFALSSARGRAGVAVIRLSGPKVVATMTALTGRTEFTPRTAHLVRISDPDTGIEIDRGLVLFFPGPASFTGEDVAEFHIHGGLAVVDLLLAALNNLPGLRPAEPGEFTRRAFENGKLDLTAAEGLGDLILAETKAQHQQALRQMKGELGKVYEDWRHRLISALAFLEADIDFSEEDLPDNIADKARPAIRNIRQEISTHLTSGSRSERLRSGLVAVILGAPNVGKSSLLNRLTREDVAIVSETAGTTRDIIEVRLDLGGYPVSLIDTAGLREAENSIEQEGVRRALAKADAADIRIVMVDNKQGEEVSSDTKVLLTSNAFLVCNKSDLASGQRRITSPTECMGAFFLSAKTGEGVKNFLAALENEVVRRLSLMESPGLTRMRHRSALEECGAFLDGYLGEDEKAPELLAENVRMAARSLGKITGRVDVEQVLDVIFADFCIGK